jgi:hypothetical protein
MPKGNSKLYLRPIWQTRKTANPNGKGWDGTFNGTAR